MEIISCFGDSYSQPMYLGGTGCRVANESIQFSGQCVGFRQGHVTLVKSIQVKPRISLVPWGKRPSFPGFTELVA